MITGRAGRARQAGRAGWLLLALASVRMLAQSHEITFTATSANVKEPGSPVRIRLNRWSTDEERSPVLAALAPTADAAAGANAANSPGAPGASARGAAGRGRGGRGRGRGRGESAAPLSPIAALTAAISRAPTVGYLWTTDVTGYSIKYAYHASSPGGGERIVLATDRRLGAYSPGWTPARGADPSAKPAAEATDYDFTLFEIRLDGKGSGEGKTSLTAKVVTDNEAHTLALDNYAATPAILEHVTR
jgi:hypothetical protein